MATTSRAGLIKECRTTTTVVELNSADLMSAQGDRALLQQTVVHLEDADIRQKFHKFQYQQATRDLEGFSLLARDLLLRLKNAVRARYGMAAEKLEEFGLNPRRRPTKPSEPGPTLPETVVPETDGTIQK
jgi:hypothetical protein